MGKLRRWIGVGAALGLLAAAALGAWALWRPHTYTGLLADPPGPAPDFTLLNPAGQPFALSELRSEWVLLTFGYTTCPDVCPVTMAHLRQTRELLGEDGAAWRVVFVSVDPERDTPEVMGDYVSHFGGNNLGLTGTAESVAAAAGAYGVQYEKRDIVTAVGYLVNHSAFTYVIDPDFRLVLTIPFGARPAEMASDLEALMARYAREKR
jgi:protein SCO1/2